MPLSERAEVDAAILGDWIHELEAVAKVSELDLSDVEPTAHPLDLVNVWAEDEPRPSLPVDEALANAPDRQTASSRCRLA